MSTNQDKEDKAALDALETEAKEFDKVCTSRWGYCRAIMSLITSSPGCRNRQSIESFSTRCVRYL